MGLDVSDEEVKKPSDSGLGGLISIPIFCALILGICIYCECGGQIKNFFKKCLPKKVDAKVLDQPIELAQADLENDETNRVPNASIPSARVEESTKQGDVVAAEVEEKQ